MPPSNGAKLSTFLRILRLKFTPVQVWRTASLGAVMLSTAHTAADHLLLSELRIATDDAAFIEIYNPTESTIALDQFYLCDDQDYAKLPGAFGGFPDPSIGTASDFLVRFPVGATIEPHQTIVIAVSSVAFFTMFGKHADFEMLSHDPGTPDMLFPLDATSPSFTPAGEMLALFFWDGASDLIADIDLLRWGNPSSVNNIASKTGLLVDGPDADATASAFLPDAMTIPTPGTNNYPAAALSLKRRLFETGHELSSGGNGLTGHDETSENILITWDFGSFTAPDPGATALNPASHTDLAVLAGGPIEAEPGETLTVTLSLNNIGVLTAANVQLHCALPPGVSLMNQQCIPPGMTLSTRGSALSWTVASMPPNAAFEIELDIELASDLQGEVALNISTSSSSSDSDASNNTAEHIIMLPSPACLADLVTSSTLLPPPDGVIDGADLAYLLGAWGPALGSSADIVTSATLAPPADGIIDGADLAVLLGAWGPCE